MVNRIVTGAHYGLRDWIVQRVSAAVMAAYALFIAGWVLIHAPVRYDAWTGLFAGDVMRSFTLLTLLAMFYHAWVGVRDIVMDYVKPALIRLAIYAVVIMALILYIVWSVQILWAF
ncbi:MAG TPA: succinate dehydrogenase, hydrophobic membrane anchor protein [Gallionellaceae bacterium]|nr:succinate dehydrogenase, hydrophobic membrane anchor protein [Gallionellaceae bacterium]